MIGADDAIDDVTSGKGVVDFEEGKLIRLESLLLCVSGMPIWVRETLVCDSGAPVWVGVTPVWVGVMPDCVSGTPG